jgi:hypothetical protein
MPPRLRRIALSHACAQDEPGDRHRIVILTEYDLQVPLQPSA